MGYKGARAVSMVARHKYGCRNIQRLVEHCVHEQVQTLVDHLLSEPDVLETCAHQFGNYAMQHIYEHGTLAQRRFLVRLLIQNAELAKDSYVCTVVGKILASGDRDDRKSLAL